MATLRLLLVATLLVLPFWVAHSAPAHACVCAVEQGDPDPFATEVARTDLIVVGKIGEMLVLPPESIEHPETLYSRTPVEVKFGVSEYLKGSAPNPVLVYYPAYNVAQEDGRVTRISGTDCDIFASVGDDYVMFLSKVDSLRYSTGVCSGTQAIRPGEDAASYLAEIRAAVAANPAGLPPTGSGPPRHSSSTIVPLIAASALAAVGLAANAAFALRRRPYLDP
jgi:hypothetical protein